MIVTRGLTAAAGARGGAMGAAGGAKGAAGCAMGAAGGAMGAAGGAMGAAGGAMGAMGTAGVYVGMKSHPTASNASGPLRYHGFSRFSRARISGHIRGVDTRGTDKNHLRLTLNPLKSPGNIKLST